jgi:outer membrane protein assembly factor BamB
MYALDAESGEKDWDFETRDIIYAANPSVFDDTVYFGSNDGFVYAVDEETGVERWRFRTHASVRASPVAVDGSLVVCSRDSNVYRLTESSGDVVGRSSAPDTPDPDYERRQMEHRGRMIAEDIIDEYPRDVRKEIEKGLAGETERSRNGSP